MRAVFVEGTAEEVADFAQRTGLVVASNGSGSATAETTLTISAS